MDELIKIGIRVPESLHLKVKAAALEKRISMEDAYRSALQDWLAGKRSDANPQADADAIKFELDGKYFQQGKNAELVGNKREPPIVLVRDSGKSYVTRETPSVSFVGLRNALVKILDAGPELIEALAQQLPAIEAQMDKTAKVSPDVSPEPEQRAHDRHAGAAVPDTSEGDATREEIALEIQERAASHDAALSKYEAKLRKSNKAGGAGRKRA